MSRVIACGFINQERITEGGTPWLKLVNPQDVFRFFLEGLILYCERQKKLEIKNLSIVLSSQKQQNLVITKSVIQLINGILIID